MNKWRVFKRPIEINLSQVPSLIECCMRLHNYCIDEWDEEWYVADLPEGAIREHVASFEEYCDALDATGANQHGGMQQFKM